MQMDSRRKFLGKVATGLAGPLDLCWALMVTAAANDPGAAPRQLDGRRRRGGRTRYPDRAATTAEEERPPLRLNDASDGRQRTVKRA